MGVSILIYVALLCAVWSFIKIAPKLFVRGLVRVAANRIGRTALARMPHQIKLSRVSTPQWGNESAMQELAGPLVRAGFNDLGTYSVDKMPGVLVRMLFQSETYVSVYVYEHPKTGSWIEFATRYTDGGLDHLTTLEDRGITPPPFVRTVHATKGTPTDSLYQQHLTKRKAIGIKPVSPNDAIREFENGFKQYMIWKHKTGVSAQEVVRVAARWSRTKTAAAGKP